MDSSQKFSYNAEYFQHAIKSLMDVNNPKFSTFQYVMDKLGSDLDRLLEKADWMVDNNMMKATMCSLESFFGAIENSSAQMEPEDIEKLYKRTSGYINAYIDSIEKPKGTFKNCLYNHIFIISYIYS